MLLSDILPTTFFPALWGALLTRAPDYLVLFYFQTPEPPFWIHIYKARWAFKLKITGGDAHFPGLETLRAKEWPCTRGPGSGHWLLTALCYLCPKLKTRGSLVSDSVPTAHAPPVHLTLSATLPPPPGWLDSPPPIIPSIVASLSPLHSLFPGSLKSSCSLI